MTNHLDKILFEIEEKGFFSITMDTPKNIMNAKQRLLRLGLITAKGKYSYDLTDKGQEAVDFGGYEAWIQQNKKEKDTDKQIKELTIKQLKRNIFQLKYWWLLLLLSGLVGFITGNFKVIQNWYK